MDADGLWWSFPGEIGGVQRPVTIKVTYDPSVFRVLEVTGSLEYFECSASGSQQLYRAKGDVKESNPIFYISTTSVPGTNPPGGGGGSGGGGGDLTGGEIRVEIYQHEETFESHYNTVSYTHLRWSIWLWRPMTCTEKEMPGCWRER